MKTLGIVGAGLFGCVIAQTFERGGWKVTLFDAQREGAASKCAGCLMRPSWMAMFDRKNIERGIFLLDELYGVEDIQFRTNGLLNTKVHFVSPDKILSRKSVKADVTAVKPKEIHVGAKVHKFDLVVVAAGVWSEELVDMHSQQRLTGASLIFPAQRIEPQISAFAPYRQAVTFKIRDGEQWFGDGTAIVEKNFGEEHIEATIKRAKNIGLKGKPKQVTVGMRPYSKEHKQGYCERIKPGLWVSTGGAKNGTVMAAIHALKIYEKEGGKK